MKFNQINVEFIPEAKMRYPSLGDYWIDDKNVLQLRIANEISDVKQQCIVIHELIEIFLCLKDNISFDEIDQFDIAIEPHLQPNEEPGNRLVAPYFIQHQKASAYEYMLSIDLGDIYQKVEDK